MGVWARRLACLLSFATRLPTGCYSLEAAAEGFPLIPIVGLVEGAAAALTAHLLAAVHPLLRGSLLLALHIAVTGGLHLDGFADYSDAIGSGARGEQALRILSDPHRGGMAVSYTFTLLAVKLAGLAYAPPAAILLAYIAASESMYLTAAALKPAKPGLGMLFKARGAGGRHTLLNAACLAVVAAAAYTLHPQAWSAGAVLAAALLSWLYAALDARGRIGGFNGDVLGFTYELAHTASLAAAALAA